MRQGSADTSSASRSLMRAALRGLKATAALLRTCASRIENSRADPELRPRVVNSGSTGFIRRDRATEKCRIRSSSRCRMLLRFRGKSERSDRWGWGGTTTIVTKSSGGFTGTADVPHGSMRRVVCSCPARSCLRRASTGPREGEERDGPDTPDQSGELTSTWSTTRFSPTATLTGR